MNRIAESADEIYDYVKLQGFAQIRFNTLGEGYFFIDKDYKLNKMIDFCCRIATDEEFNNLWKYLERDMIQVEQKRGYQWYPIHQPKGKSFETAK
jgi:hypothetical protein